MSSDNAAARAPARKIPNVWAMDGEKNPYLHNVFVLLGIDPDEGERALERRCRRVEERLEGRQAVTVQGRAVEEADVARARHLAAREEEYVAQRLLVHTAHKMDLKAFQQSMQEIERLRFERPEDVLPLPIRDLSFVSRLLPELADVAAGEAQPLEPEQWETLIRPDPAEERIVEL